MSTSATFPLPEFVPPPARVVTARPAGGGISDVEIGREDSARDLVFVDGDLVLLHGSKARAQRIYVAMAHFRGEWFLDLNAGTDYFGRILGKSSDLSRRAEFRRRILGVPGVVEITTMALSLDARTRNLSGTIHCVDVEGITQTVNVTEPGG